MNPVGERCPSLAGIQSDWDAYADPYGSLFPLTPVESVLCAGQRVAGAGDVVVGVSDRGVQVVHVRLTSGDVLVRLRELRRGLSNGGFHAVGFFKVARELVAGLRKPLGCLVRRGPNVLASESQS